MWYLPTAESIMTDTVI